MTELAAPEKVWRGARAAQGKKAGGLVVLNLQGLSNVSDYFLICSGRSTVQIRIIAEAIEEEMKRGGFGCLGREGEPESGWIVLDYGELVVHVFQEETRNYYGLERLWGDALILTPTEDRG
jgi:ribosome-associated protein